MLTDIGDDRELVIVKLERCKLDENGQAFWHRGDLVVGQIQGGEVQELGDGLGNGH